MYNLLHNMNLCLYITGCQKIFPLSVTPHAPPWQHISSARDCAKKTADRLTINLSAAPYKAFYSLKPRKTPTVKNTLSTFRLLAPRLLPYLLQSSASPFPPFSLLLFPFLFLFSFPSACPFLL